MQFASKNKRSIFIAFLFGFLFNSAVALIFAKFSDSGDKGEAFLLVFLGIYVVSFLLWVKNSIGSWIYFFLFGRAQGAKGIYSYLRDSEFPMPDEYQDSAADFFLELAEDKEQEPEIRAKAAATTGNLSVLISLGRFQDYLRLSMMCEDAIDRYRESFSNRTLESK